MADGRTHQVFEVIDASPMGIRLRVNAPLDIGRDVVIRYLAEGVDLQLNGTVIWNDDSTETAAAARQVIGIRLTSPSLLQAFW